MSRWGGNDLFCYGCYERKPRAWFVVPGRRALSRRCTACWARIAVEAKTVPVGVRDRPLCPKCRKEVRAGDAMPCADDCPQWLGNPVDLHSAPLIRVGYGPVLGHTVKLDNIRYTTADRARQAMELYSGGRGGA